MFTSIGAERGPRGRPLIERDIAVDEADDAKVARLDALILEAVDRLALHALMPEAA